jgi:hypothetical protein
MEKHSISEREDRQQERFGDGSLRVFVHEAAGVVDVVVYHQVQVLLGVVEGHVSVRQVAHCCR